MPTPTPPQPTQHDLRLPDGRRVRTLELGRRDGIAVIGLHGTPGSRLEFRAAHAASVRLGIRLIAPDRWSYGGTEAPDTLSLPRYAADLAAIADALGIDRFAVIGISGGGPYAAVAASCLPNRITRAALVSPVGLLRGRNAGRVGFFHRLSFGVLPQVPGAMRITFGAFRAIALRNPGLAVRMAMAMARAPVTDRVIMVSPVRRLAMAETFAEGLAQSAEGPVTDMALFAGDWDADLGRRARVRVWIGTSDGNVPVDGARALAYRMSAHLVEIERAGHYWIETGWEEVLAWAAHPTS